MSLLQQIALLPSGSQSNSIRNLLHVSEDRLFYASTLAVYILNAKTFVTEKILSYNERVITAIALSPHDSNMLSMCGCDGKICCWNINDEEIISTAYIATDKMLLLEWFPDDSDYCAIITNEPLARLLQW